MLNRPSGNASAVGGSAGVSFGPLTSRKFFSAVNAIVPGVTDTEMTHERIQENITHYREKVPLQRPATADEVAEPILFLISETATYITGQNIHVNGGWRLA